MKSILEVTEHSFDSEVLQSHVPVLTVFCAEWSGPCKSLAAVMPKLANEYAKELKVTRLNVDDNFKSVLQFAIDRVPTMILFKNGRAVKRLIGAVSGGELRRHIQLFLGSRDL